jgi:hypothetical protein
LCPHPGTHFLAASAFTQPWYTRIVCARYKGHSVLQLTLHLVSLHDCPCCWALHCIGALPTGTTYAGACNVLIFLAQGGKKERDSVSDSLKNFIDSACRCVVGNHRHSHDHTTMPSPVHTCSTLITSYAIRLCVAVPPANQTSHPQPRQHTRPSPITRTGETGRVTDTHSLVESASVATDMIILFFNVVAGIGLTLCFFMLWLSFRCGLYTTASGQ